MGLSNAVSGERLGRYILIIGRHVYSVKSEGKRGIQCSVASSGLLGINSP